MVEVIMKIKKILASICFFLSIFVAINCMENSSVINCLEAMSNVYLVGNADTWTKEMCDEGFLKCKIKIERDLGEVIDHGFTKILKAYLMFYDPQLKNVQGVDKNILFYAVGQEKIEAVKIILDHIKDNKFIINRQNNEGRTVVEEVIKVQLKSITTEFKDTIAILKLLISHKHIDFTTQDSRGYTLLGQAYEYSHDLYEMFKKAEEKQRQCCPEWCIIV